MGVNPALPKFDIDWTAQQVDEQHATPIPGWIVDAVWKLSHEQKRTLVGAILRQYAKDAGFNSPEEACVMKLMLPPNPTWNDLMVALKANGFEKAAGWIEAWVDEYLPGQENKTLPKGPND